MSNSKTLRTACQQMGDVIFPSPRGGRRYDHCHPVNPPELARRTRKDGDTLHTRSLALSSEGLGITGVLDVLEERAGDSYPVETKHGSAPRDEDGKAGFWDNDAVQLCAQGLLLEEE